MQLNSLKRCVAAALATVLLSAVQLAQASYPFREMVNPPTHLSNLGLSSSCDTSYPTFALEPNDNQKHPLFILMPGTNFNGVNNDVPLNGSLYRIFLERMAERGFVAVVAEYDNEFNLLTFNDNGFAARAACMFDKTKTSSLINTLCSRSNVDCSLGIATSGHSQGGILALAASHYESRVSASDISGTADQNGPRADLPFNRIRLTNAENDGGNTINGTNASTAGNNSATGMNCSTSTNSCLRADGSGWVMVRQSQLLENNADHCWFFKTGCDANAPENIEPTWWDPVTQPNYDYSLIPRANWLAATAVAPRTCPSKYVALKSKVNGKYVSARLSTSGIPLQATASSAADWEKFACIEVGNGQVTLKAINGNFVTANAANGQKLEATNSVAGTAGTFNYITISGSTIALKGVSNGRYVDVKTNQSNQLVMDQSSAVTSATYEIIAK